MSAHILVIEDEPAIRRGVVDALRAADYTVSEASDGQEGVKLALGERVDLILLDLRLPKKEGLDVLADVRRVKAQVPVIILTAKGTEDDRVKGLKMGADDYVVKPFSARELLARVEAILRRTIGQGNEIQAAKLGHAQIDLERREISWSETERSELSETETSILIFLVSHRKRAVSREELLSHIWGIEPRGLETRTIDMHIARLRNKLRDPSGRETPDAILTVRSHGYMASPDLLPLENVPAAE